MNAQRSAAIVATLAVLSLGLSACAPDPAGPAAPAPTTSGTSIAAEPTTEGATAPAVEDPTAPADTTEPAESTPADPADDAPALDPAEGDLPGAAACYDGGEIRVLDPAVEPAAGAVRAWLCGDASGGHGTVGPMEPLVSDVDAILADFEALPEALAEGPQEAAGVYRVVFEYADGTFAVIEGDAQSDGAVWAGGQGRSDGLGFLNVVRGRWLDQRMAVGAPAEDAVDHAMACPAPERYIVAHPIEHVSGGWICAGNSEEPTALPMDDGLAVAIAGELRENSTPAEDGSPASGTTLSLMVAWGDATVLKALDDESGYLWISDQGAMKYTPSAETEDAISAAAANR